MADFLPWMPLYFEEFERGTKGFSAEERWAYLALLWHQWERGAVPNDVRRLAHIAGETPARFRRMWEGAIGAKFRAHDTDASLLVNDRQDAERNREAVKIAINKANGAKGGSAKVANATPEGAKSVASGVANATKEGPQNVASGVANATPEGSEILATATHTLTDYKDLKAISHTAGVGARAATPGAAPWPHGADERWRIASGVNGITFSGLSTLVEHVEAAAKQSNADPAGLFDRAVAEFRAYRETCSGQYIPQLAPLNVVKHWGTVWERLQGTAPKGTPAVARPVEPQRPRLKPFVDPALAAARKAAP